MEPFTIVTGAAFSMWGKAQQSTDWYIYPAVFALCLSILDVIYFVLVFKESLPVSRRNQSTSATFHQALDYINPLQLFRLVKKIEFSIL